MPRRSSRAVPAPSTATEPALKRRASARLASAKSPPKKQKTVKSTPKESKYFNDKAFVTSGSESDDASDSQSTVSTDNGVKGKSLSQAQEPMLTSQRTGQKRVKRVKNTRTKRAGRAQRDSMLTTVGTPSDLDTDAEQKLKTELWREGVKTGLGPGKEIFIEKPKARDPGNVPYQDDALHPNTKLFLEDLAENNDRMWLKGN